MNKKRVLVVVGGALVIGGLISTKLPTQSLKDSNVVNASETLSEDSFDKENRISNKKIYSNSDKDKEKLLNLMVNSICYYSTASGNFDYYSKNAETDMNIDFDIDLINSKSYEKHTFKNIEVRSLSIPTEEFSFNGQYYSIYRSAGLMETFSSTDSKSIDKNRDGEFIYRKIFTPTSFKSSNRMYETYEDSIRSIDGEEVYARKNENSMMGTSSTVLFPEDFAMNFMTTNLNNWKVVNNEQYLNRDTVLVETSLSQYFSDKHNAEKSVIRIDVDTGIMLEANLLNKDGESTFKVKVNKLVLNESIDSQVFEKYTSMIKEEK